LLSRRNAVRRNEIDAR